MHKDKQLAPIGLSVYSRVGHLRRNVEALKQNELADRSDLYIFSDAPRTEHKEKVQQVRDYIKTISGFKSVTIWEREKNNRIENNRGGIRDVLNKHGKIIFLEEDAVTDVSFLRFMNEALDRYENDQRILTVCGYTPAISLPPEYPHDVFLARRMTACAFAIWKDRYEQIITQISKNDLDDVLRDRKKRLEFRKAGGISLAGLLATTLRGFDGLDAKIDYTLYKNKQFTLRPVKSLVQPIGHDGSGEHWTKSTAKYDVSLSGKHWGFTFPEKLNEDLGIMRAMQKFYALPISIELILLMQRYGLYELYFKAKNKIKRSRH